MTSTSTQELSEILAKAQSSFLASVADLRPPLHRFCSKMVGSALDGEDLVQEILAQAYYNLSQLRTNRPLRPWLFRIAHNRCIDFLRLHRIHLVQLDDAEAGEGAEEFQTSSLEAPDGPLTTKESVNLALLALVGQLAPKERACLVLKDVMGYSIAEIATIVDSSLGGTKAALYRARQKMRDCEQEPGQPECASEHDSVITRYIDCFNRRDWNALRDVLSADARLELVGTVSAEGRDFLEENYFHNYRNQTVPWHFTLGWVDGEPVPVCWRQLDGQWRMHSVLRLAVRDGKISQIQDFFHVDYLLAEASVVAPPPTLVK